MATAHSMPSGLTFPSATVDMENFDSLFDFTEMSNTPTLSQPAKLQQPASRSSSITSPASTTLNLSETDDQTPTVPSHEYDRYKQQTGLPSGSLNSLGSFGQSQQSDGLDSAISFSGIGLDESSFMNDADLTGPSNVGITADPNMEWDVTPSNVTTFFPQNFESDGFVNPSNLEERPNQQIRFFPGMHQQQAQRKQQEMIQQRQQQLQQQQAAQRQRENPRSHPSRRSASNITDARTEETIARVVNQIRHSSSSVKDEGSGGSLLPQIIRMKKDEEDMDEDERLLASEEGKKLSSKERRQLRNKVSARAFRSRRKEYIGQLEGEVSMKTNEANDLRLQNRALMEENARSRSFIEKLLRHPAFHPFLEDLSRDPALLQSSSPQNQASMGQVQQKESRQVPTSMPMIPEQPSQPDLSGLNLNSTADDLWASGNMGFNFNQTQIFAVTELPETPIDIEALSGKSSQSPVIESSDSKVDYPVIDRPTLAAQPKEQLPTERESAPTQDEVVAVQEAEDESDIVDDPSFALYVNSSSSAPTTSTPNDEPLFGSMAPEKVFGHFWLHVPNEAEESALLATLDASIADMDATCRRIQDMTERNE